MRVMLDSKYTLCAHKSNYSYIEVWVPEFNKFVRWPMCKDHRCDIPEAPCVRAGHEQEFNEWKLTHDCLFHREKVNYILVF